MVSYILANLINRLFTQFLYRSLVKQAKSAMQYVMTLQTAIKNFGR